MQRLIIHGRWIAGTVLVFVLLGSFNNCNFPVNGSTTSKTPFTISASLLDSTAEATSLDELNPPPQQVNLVWYENDHFQDDHRSPENGGWFAMNPDHPNRVRSIGTFRTVNPLLGLYDSRDTDTIRQHAYWMRAAGFDGLVIDWTNILGRGDLADPISAYSERVRESTTRVFQTLASLPFPMKVVIAIRIERGMHDGMQMTNAQRKRLADDVAQLYGRFPAQALLLQGPANRARFPLVLAFSDFGREWLEAPQWAEARFNLRFMNGYLKRRTIPTRALSPLVSAIPGQLPYWSFIEEDQKTPAKDYTKLVNLAPAGRHVEMAQVWLALHQGGTSWDELHQQINGRNTLERQFDSLRGVNPEVLIVNRFNYGVAALSEPQEGLSLETSQVLEPTVEFGWSIYNNVSVELARFRGYDRHAPGTPILLAQNSEQLRFRADGWPTEYQLAFEDPQQAGSWERIQSVEIPVSLSRSGVPVFLRVKNPWGISAWLTVPSPPPAAEPLPTPAAPQSVSLRSSFSGFCLDAESQQGGFGPEALFTWTCNGNPQQHWELEERNGMLFVRNRHFKTCLDIPADRLSENGTRVQLWDCNGSANQGFHLERQEGTTRLRSAANGKCLDFPAHIAPDRGSYVQVCDCSNAGQQNWELRP